MKNVLIVIKKYIKTESNYTFRVNYYTFQYEENRETFEYLSIYVEVFANTFFHRYLHKCFQ